MFRHIEIGRREVWGKCRWCHADIATEQATPEYRAAKAARVARRKERAEQKKKKAQEAKNEAQRVRNVDPNQILARTGRATRVPRLRRRAWVPEGLTRTAGATGRHIFIHSCLFRVENP